MRPALPLGFFGTWLWGLGFGDLVLGTWVSGDLPMSSEDTPRDRQPLVVPFRGTDHMRRTHKSNHRDHEFHDVLTSPLSEDTALSDDESRQRSVDNILALLKANAE